MKVVGKRVKQRMINDFLRNAWQVHTWVKV